MANTTKMFGKHLTEWQITSAEAKICDLNRKITGIMESLHQNISETQINCQFKLNDPWWQQKYGWKAEDMGQFLYYLDTSTRKILRWLEKLQLKMSLIKLALNTTCCLNIHSSKSIYLSIYLSKLVSSISICSNLSIYLSIYLSQTVTKYFKYLMWYLWRTNILQ